MWNGWIKKNVCLHRLQQLEEENGKMKINVCRLKSQTEKLDQVILIMISSFLIFAILYMIHCISTLDLRAVVTIVADTP